MKRSFVFCLGLSLLPIAASGQTTWTESTLYTFTGTKELLPDSLMQASDGNFYGVMPSITAQTPGFIYQVTPAGQYTQIYAFDGAAHGEHPNGRLVEGPDGFLYGLTGVGGANNNGVFYKIPLGTSGALQVLYTVPASSANAPTNCLADSQNGFTLGSDGNFYSASVECMFAMDSQGGVSIFTQSEEDLMSGTSTGVLQTSDGNYYSANEVGLYQLVPGNSSLNFIAWTDFNDCNYPVFDLVQGFNGDVYYNSSDNTKQQFCQTASATNSVVYTFAASGTQRELPSPILGSDGNFYGVEATGASTYGDVWQITQAGAESTIFTFDVTDGTKPQGGMIQGNDGALYGVTSFAGSVNSPLPGEVFNLTASPALAAPVQMSFTPSNPTAGSSATINWSVSNAFSTSMQQCYAYGNWSGKQTGTYNSTTHLYSGTASIVIPSSGSYNYALTCGGRESQILASSLLASSTALSVSPNPQTVGDNVTISVTVSGSGPTPNGQVQLKVGADVVATLPLSGGKASLTTSTSAYPAGTYPLQAFYSGNATYQGSSSSVVNVVLNKAATTTTLTATPNPVTPPANITLKATVASAGPGIHPTGTVTFFTGTTEVGSAKISSGVASLTAPTGAIPAGNYPVIAKYAGDGDNKVSQSSALTVIVK